MTHLFPGVGVLVGSSTARKSGGVLPVPHEGDPAVQDRCAARTATNLAPGTADTLKPNPKLLLIGGMTVLPFQITRNVLQRRLVFWSEYNEVATAFDQLI